MAAVEARVGAIHLGWDVLTVGAAVGTHDPVPLPVEGDFYPPAYLLADGTGHLHVGSIQSAPPGVGLAIPDVRDILGHGEIEIAGAVWPGASIFQARLAGPITTIFEYFGGPPDVLAMPYPDSWKQSKVEEFTEFVEELGVEVEAVPESVALAGYARVSDAIDEGAPGTTVVYSDSRGLLVVAVHTDDSVPTASIDVPLPKDARKDPTVADEVVNAVVGAARSIGAHTGTVQLAGNVVYNEFVRLAFKNHLGNRMRIADDPIHAVALGAASLIASEEYDEVDGA